MSEEVARSAALCSGRRYEERAGGKDVALRLELVTVIASIKLIIFVMVFMVFLCLFYGR